MEKLRQKARESLMYKLMQLNHSEMETLLLQAVECFPFIESFINKKIAA